MKGITVVQKVKLFCDQDDLGEQEVFISVDDHCGIWLNISHNGYEMSLSLANWEKLIALSKIARSKIIRSKISNSR
ncbi:hypothetical protein OIU80_02500 [Flavobacterium sp. LS1R47]|uniref:Uncharacterized protein n=1 Tax=Flavobacterium frigoritolerans TaxID=2987686 RepID=A0A9X2ZKM5_9FLAO|nr:hypothetical protein [Flavobacterium frigoritolerans]MCV9931140.1 hypothetical protein [Flavobacterium frigoritolerans]